MKALRINLTIPRQPQKPIGKILKTFANAFKIPLIPPLLIGNQLVSDFLEKANLFNEYFSKQCTTIGNNNRAVPANTSFVTEERLSTFEFCPGDIVKIISHWILIRPMDTMK